MTYREIYAAKYGEAAAKTVHIGHCPDQMMAYSAAKAVFKCPAHSNNGLADCAACWDSPAAIEDFQPEELRENGAEIRVEVTGESIHVQSHGNPAEPDCPRVVEQCVAAMMANIDALRAQNEWYAFIGQEAQRGNCC